MYDDLVLVVDNPALADPWDLTALVTQPLYGVEQGYWRPVTALVLSWGKALGSAPLLHGIALALHAFVALQVALLGRDLGLGPRVAGAVATLFAVHPAVVEPAAWIASINDPLSVAAALLALRSQLAWRGRGAVGVPSSALAWFACALLAKENALAALPVLLVAGGVWSRSVLLGYGGVVTAWAVGRALVLGTGMAGVGADVEGLTLVRTEVAGRLFARLVWPSSGSPFVAPTGSIAFVLSGVAASVVLGVFALRARAPSVRVAAVAALAVVVPVAARVEALGPYPVADRYVYLAIAAAAPVLGFLFARRSDRVAVIALGLLACAFAPITFLRVGVWQSPQSLVDAGLSARPADPRLLCMAGEIAFGDFQGTGARADLERATLAYGAAQQQLAEPLWNGSAARRVVEADVGLGLAYCALAGAGHPMQVSAAVQAFERLVGAFPEFGKAWLGLGVARASSGRRFEARSAFERAVELMPRSFEARVNLGRVLALVGEPARARAELEVAASLRPGDPLIAELLDGLPR